MIWTWLKFNYSITCRHGKILAVSIYLMPKILKTFKTNWDDKALVITVQFDNCRQKVTEMIRTLFHHHLWSMSQRSQTSYSSLDDILDALGGAKYFSSLD